jgi:hypothetical protein
LSDADARRDSPAWILQQTELIKRLVAKGGFGRDAIPDLFYTNYKQPDRVGHIWNMLLPEMRSTLKYTDEQIAALTGFLDRTIGRRRWVMVVTADHGQGPLAEEAHAWPIDADELLDDLAEHFGVELAPLLDRRTPVGYYFEDDYLAEAGLDLEEVSEFLIGYRLQDNVAEGRRVPSQYERRLREPLLAAAFPSDELAGIIDCARRG